MVTFGTKAETLEAIRGRLRGADICASVFFSVADWRADAPELVRKVRENLGQCNLIVRSSALNEDAAHSALAGAFSSVADVRSTDDDGLKSAVEEVIRSFEKASHSKHLQNQILIQPMVTNVSMSGVVFTHDLNTGAPYFVINYDDESGKTDTITSGNGDTSRTLLVHRGKVEKVRSTRFRALLKAVQEVEALMPAAALDIEFAVTKDEKIYILQVRRLTVQQNWNRDIARKIDQAISQIETFLDERMGPVQGVLGTRTVYAEMTDWNPAEMIGTSPRALARSLYRFLITDKTWAEARHELGYADRTLSSLMVDLSGKPFIDVRESLNSFLPASISAEIGEALVDAWITHLKAHPELHDKVEFEVAVTSLPLDFPQVMQGERAQYSRLNPAELDRFRQALRSLTEGILSRWPEIRATQIRKLEALEKLRISTANRQGDAFGTLNEASLLLQSCAQDGTKPFAVLARCAFIAEDLLRSLVRMKALTADRAQALRGSVRTVLSEFLGAVQAINSRELSLDDFFRTYGHLRPGTYDILSPRYDQRDREFFLARREIGGKGATHPAGEFTFTADETARVSQAIQGAGLSVSAEAMLAFVKEAIQAREFGKFQFTRVVSDVLELIAGWGERLGLSREEVSHLSIGEILAARSEASNVPPEDHFRELSRTNEADHRITQAVRLPFLISELSDVHVIPLLKARPNFITNKKVHGEIVCVSGADVTPYEIEGKIVLIEGADPGYDWIFMASIAGLVTKYGGANSHMAIRCAEVGVPAAIGCGEQMYELLQEASCVLLDAGACLLVPEE